jgi:hypothetical protein
MESVKPGAFQSHGIGGASAAPANGLRFSQLSAPRQTLVRLCQAINHGSIENLEVRSSEPVFNPLPVTVKDVKLDADEEARPEQGLADFVVSDEVMRLIRLLDELGCGTLRRIEVHAGLPRRILVESQVAGAPEVLPRQVRRSQ